MSSLSSNLRFQHPLPPFDGDKFQALDPDARELLVTLRERFVYDRTTGAFLWAIPFPVARAQVGDIAGNRPKTAKTGSNRHRICVNGKNYARARLVWLWFKFEMPSKTIDHNNNDHTDDRFHNLREATRTEQALNTAVRKSNTSGHRGIYWHKASQRWMVSLKKKGHTIPSKTFQHNDLEQAVAYRKKLEETYAPGIIRK